jgi:hypothetical protein
MREGEGRGKMENRKRKIPGGGQNASRISARAIAEKEKARLFEGRAFLF